MESDDIMRELKKYDEQIENENRDNPWLVFVAEKGENCCKKCIAFHGQRFREWDTKRPALPIHPNCKCKYEKLDKNTAKKVAVHSVTIRTKDSPGIGGIRVNSIDDMLSRLEKEYAPGTISELIITGHGEFSGEFEIGGKADRLDLMSDEQISRLKKLLMPNAVIDIRMCYGIQDSKGEEVAQRLANRLGCQVRAYANQVSPLGTAPAPWQKKNIHVEWWRRPFTGAGGKTFHPEK